MHGLDGDKIKTWTGLSVEESIRTTEDRDEWRKYVHAVANPRSRSCLEKETMKGTMPGARRRGRPRTAWMDNIKTWTGLPVEESIRMTEDKR